MDFISLFIIISIIVLYMMYIIVNCILSFDTVKVIHDKLLDQLGSGK